jgi:hypothetical protein
LNRRSKYEKQVRRTEDILEDANKRLVGRASRRSGRVRTAKKATAGGSTASPQITPKGWVQSEMNGKVTKEGKVVATEVGWVEYRLPVTWPKNFTPASEG